tara:strand:- start:692 stop:937 length:246 start_codon:yes stop_codon:yes gene_type:complete
MTSAEVLVSIVDKKAKLLPRLYKKRLEVDFKEEKHKSSSSTNSNVTCCRHCHRLFTDHHSQTGLLRCNSKSRLVIGKNGGE